jgi:hypothetical protein
MEVCQFRGRIYGKINGALFVFEETWDSFRPIKRVYWNGKKFATDDTDFKANLFDENYGFGSSDMKDFCKKITEDTELGGAELNPTDFWNWCGTRTEWFHDRRCVLSGCESRDWKKFIIRSGSKPRTLRRPHGCRVTRRLVAKGLKV